MLITVSLMSKKEGEIKRFLDSYYGKESDVDELVIEWIYVYRNEMQAISLIDTVMDNYDEYDLSLWIKIDDEDVIEVTKHSRTRITKEIMGDRGRQGNF